jgi:5'(3')-deoxyribonucleotidase
MKKKIIFDLDGVLRDLLSIFRERFNVPQTSTWIFTHNGKTIYDYIKEDYSVLYKAEPTQYLDVIKEYIGKSKIEIWSYQPEDWIKYTKKWLNIFLKDKYIIKYLNPEEKYRKLKENKDMFLVEDYPLFPDYSRIILIDTSYNQEVKPFVRVKDKEELKTLLWKYK